MGTNIYTGFEVIALVAIGILLGFVTGVMFTL